MANRKQKTQDPRKLPAGTTSVDEFRALEKGPRFPLPKGYKPAPTAPGDDEIEREAPDSQGA